MGTQAGADLFDDVTESPPAPESDFNSLNSGVGQKKVAVASVLPVTLVKACAIPPPLPLNYNTVSTGRLFQHTSRLIILTSDPLCSKAFRSLRRMYLSSHAVTSQFLKKRKKKKSCTLKWI